MLHSPANEDALVQSSIQLQNRPARSLVDKPAISSTSLRENQRELETSCEDLDPNLPAGSKNGLGSSSGVSLKSRKLLSYPIQKQVDNATVVPGELSHSVAALVNTCSRSSPRVSTSQLKLNSQLTGNTQGQHLKYADGKAIHAVPSSGNKQNYACLETETKVVFTIERPEQMEELSNVQEIDKQSGKVGSARSGYKEPVSPVFMVDKTSLPQYRFHLYQAPQYDQRAAVPDSCATTQRHHRKQSTGTYIPGDEQVTFATQGSHRQSTWDRNTDKQVFPLNSFTTPSGPWAIPVYSTPIQVTAPGSQPELSHAAGEVLKPSPGPTRSENINIPSGGVACCLQHRPTERILTTLPEPPKPVRLLKPFTWPWPNDMPAYSSVQDQDSQLCGGNLGVAQVQGKRGELSAAQLLQPPSCTPKIMLTSPYQPMTVPHGMTDNAAVMEEPLVHPFGGYGCIPQPNGVGSVLLRPQFARVPMVPPQCFPMNCPLWTCSLNSVPMLPTPSARCPQYPNISEMFKTAKLLPEQRAASEDHHLKAMVRPGTATRLPQDTIQVNLKVQDDTAQPATTNAVSDSQAKKSATQCSVCRKTFSRTSTLKSHMRIHTGDKPYKCLVCGRLFPQYGSLKTHERCHTGEKPYSCSLCEKRFSHSSSLRTHARIHTGERPFHCTWPGCGKQFKDKSTQMKHQCVHTKAKPYGCPDCGLRFTQVGNMRKHQAKIHGAARHRGKRAENDAAFVQRCDSLGMGGLSSGQT